jgi:four helix bundle protein
MRNIKDNAIVNMTCNFSLQIIDVVQQLKSQKDWDLASQRFRPGTSIGANVWEAQNADRSKVFIHSFKISAKECDETDTGWNYVRHQSSFLLHKMGFSRTENPYQKYFQKL